MSETKKCIECGEEISVNAEICPKCGVRQMPAGETKFCKDCGAKISKNAEICPKCGVRQVSSITSAFGSIDTDKNKICCPDRSRGLSLRSICR